MSKTKPDFGILILGFNRPDVLEKTLSSLRAFADFSEAHVFLSLDGPRENDDISLVQTCMKKFDLFAEEIPKASKLYSPQNQGLRNNVMNSVTEAFGTVQKLLVLEDDCAIGKTTIEYFNWGFHQLAVRDDMGAISGNYLGPKKTNQAFLAKRFASWGWATNKKTWQGFMESEYSQLPIAKLRADLVRLTKNDPLPYKYEYRKMSKRLEVLDSWAIPFSLFLRSEQLLTIKPTLNQIHNIGFGVGATHTVRGNSLSIETASIDHSSLNLLSPAGSRAIERREAWTKFSRLAKELVFGS